MIKIIENLIKWNNDNLGNVDNSNDYYKLLFILSNIVYFIPILYYGIINQYTIVLAIMGLFSIIFHLHQCCNNVSRNNTCSLMWIDVFVSCILGIYLWINKFSSLTIYWYITFLIALAFYICGTNKLHPHLYMLYHGLWHILTGILFVIILTI